MSMGKHALTILPCLFVADILATSCYRVAPSSLQKIGLCVDKAFQLRRLRSLDSRGGGFRVAQWLVDKAGRHLRGGEPTWKFEREAEAWAEPHPSKPHSAAGLSPTKLPSRPAISAPHAQSRISVENRPQPSQISGSSTILRFAKSRKSTIPPPW